MIDLSFTILSDTATPTLARLARFASTPQVMDVIRKDCETLTRNHILANGSNKQGWPSTGFYREVAARGVDSEATSDGFLIKVDHPDKPGSMRQRYHGGTINMRDKLLTIPARQEFYGHAAGEFDNLKAGVFRNTGTKFLYINQGGTGRGRNHSYRSGTGQRNALMVAYWLKESVTQQADAAVVPQQAEYVQQAMYSLHAAYNQYIRSKGGVS